MTTFKQYATDWLDYRLKTGEFSPNTIHKDKSIVKLLIVKFGKYRLDNITPLVIKDKYKSLYQQYSSAYMSHIYKKMKMIFRSAVEDGYISTSPMSSIKAPKVQYARKRAMSKVEYTQAIDLLRHDLNQNTVAILILLMLGLRRAEACALQWSDINEDNIITIDKAVKEHDGSVGDTKNGMHRHLPLPPVLLDILQEWKIRQGAEQLYICSNRNRHRRPQDLYKWYKVNRERYGLSDYSLHELRHTNLTFMARLVSQWDLMQWAGWTDISVAKTYIHSDREALISGAQNLLNSVSKSDISAGQGLIFGGPLGVRTLDLGDENKQVRAQKFEGVYFTKSKNSEITISTTFD